jgi:hypothetical protein
MSIIYHELIIMQSTLTEIKRGLFTLPPFYYHLILLITKLFNIGVVALQ